MMDPETQAEYARMKSTPTGGKMTQMVVIGIGHHQDEITQALNLCLATDEELAQPRHQHQDPFSDMMHM